MKFMKHILASVLVLSALTSIGQVVGGMDFKLEKLYNEEKWEDLGDRALKMTEDDKYKKDPEPFLYLSMAFYQISQSNDEKLKTDYPKALADAVKFATKFRSKDKEGTWYQDNKDYFEELKKAAIADAMPYVDDDKKRRNAVTAFKNLSKAIPEDHNILFYKGVLETMARNEAEADRNIIDAMKGLSASYADSKYKPSKSSAYLLEDGMIRWADLLIQKSYVDSARKTLDVWGKQFFPNSEKIKSKAESIALKKK
jgi:hypothetical protein